MEHERSFWRPTRSPEEQRELADKRERKLLIQQTLRDARDEIARSWARAYTLNENTFSISLDDLTGGGLFTRNEVASIIRQWVFENYDKRLGLYGYDAHADKITFICREESPR